MFGLTLALAAGFSAALASLFAKLAMSPHILRRVSCDNLVLQSLVTYVAPSVPCSWVILSCRVLSLVMVSVLNALMWTLFVKSLRKCSSTAVATVTNTGSNLVCTAILGMVFFEESQSMRWWLGASMIITGLVLIHHSTKTVTTDRTKKDASKPKKQ